VVVQCPTCQSKFRIADEKVTDRGVRVRCTSCKNVFQVRKPGSSGADQTPGPGNTMDLSALGAAAVAKSGSTGPVKTGSTGPVKTGSTGPVKTGSTGPIKAGAAARPSTGPVKPSTGPVRPSTDKVRGAARQAASQTEAGAARRLDADDLFGMAELTGDAPLSAGLDASAPPPPAPEPETAAAKPATSLPGLDDLDLEIVDRPAQKTARPPPLPELDEPHPPPPPLDPPADSVAGSLPDVAGPMVLDDPFAAIAPGGSAAAANDSPTEEKPVRASESRPRTDPVLRRDPAPAAPPAEPEVAPARALISSAITGLLGAALAIAVVIASALSDDSAAGWFGFGTAVDVIPTGVVSGLYDTAGGKPVFFVRGRVENRSNKVRGPVRVTAELVADGTSEAKADAIAGAEPTPEDVWSLRSPADAEKLTRTLQTARVDRSIAPGASLPFFALIPDPPADLVKHRLQVRVETAEAWKQPGAKSARNR
jgi:predicted Zn finger-like uncharacterized protein